MSFFKKIDIYYICTFLFLLLTSNANFLSLTNVYWVVILAFLLLVAITKKSITQKELVYIGVFSLVYLIFVIVRAVFINNLETDYLLSDITFLFKYIFLSYLFIAIQKERTIPYLVTVVVHLTAISFFFYFIQLVAPDEFYAFSTSLPFPKVNDLEGYTNMILYTFTKERHDYKNSGFMWEPGSYGCVLVIIFMLHLFTNGFKFDTKSKIIIFGLLTTFSTTSYLSLLVLMFLAYRYKVPRINRWFFLILPVAIVLLITIPFLGDKIVETYYADMSDLKRLSVLDKYYHKQNASIPLNRFASMTYIYDTFGEQLILGVNNRYTEILNRKMNVDISNGTFDFIAKFGVVGLLYLIFCFGRYCYRQLKNAEFAFYCVAIILIMSFGEPILHLPLMLLFLFLQPLKPKSRSGLELSENRQKFHEYT